MAVLDAPFPRADCVTAGPTRLWVDTQGTMRLPRSPRMTPYAAGAPPRSRADNPPCRLPGLSVVIPLARHSAGTFLFVEPRRHSTLKRRSRA